MKEIFLQYAAYNLWANNLLLSAVEALPEEKQTAEITSSFPSLFKRFYTCWTLKACGGNG